MSHRVHVGVFPYDRPLRVVAFGTGALAGACTRAPNVERSEGPVRGAHVGVIHVFLVNVVSRRLPLQVDALAESTLAGA